MTNYGSTYNELNKRKKRKLKISEDDEATVIKLLEESIGGKVYESSYSEDVYKHIDLWWEYKDKKYGIDVKGIRESVSDKTVKDPTIQYVELRGVNNTLGSLFGNQTYMIFITDKSMIVVRRNKLENHVKKLLNDDELFDMCKNNIELPFSKEFNEKHNIKSNNKYNFYAPHTRWFKQIPRHDITIKIKVDDLRECMQGELFF